MQNIVIAKPYRFVPPRFSPFWAKVIEWYLPGYLRRSFGITSWECVGAERIERSVAEGCGVLLAPNHCRPCDPMVMGLLARQIGRPFNVMASWHLFMQNRIQAFLLPRIGGFSVYREGLDRESLRCATQILVKAQFPLVLFAEGFVTRNNDRVYNLMEGVSFLARNAAKQRAETSPRGGKVMVHPVFIRYFFEGDITATITPVLEHIEARLSWKKQDHLQLRERIVKAGLALLALKEMEYLGAPQPGDVGARVGLLLERLLTPLEKEWLGGRAEPDVMARIKRLRGAILPDMVHKDLPETESSRRWGQLTDLYLAQQLHCYSGDYLSGTPSPERMLETVERYEEDLTGLSRPHPPLHAVISVGEAIEAGTTRDRRSETDPIAQEIRRQLENMMEETKQARGGMRRDQTVDAGPTTGGGLTRN
jgi:1-acyl-sn-glycerol-3-phosphate acyltransferase